MSTSPDDKAENLFTPANFHDGWPNLFVGVSGIASVSEVTSSLECRFRSAHFVRISLQSRFQFRMLSRSAGSAS
jgi:hypothetical protein